MKRLIDLAIVLVAMPFWAPLLAVLALVKFIMDGAPLLYRSKRIGRHGKPFTVFKFRTMVDDPKFISEQIAQLGRSGFEAIPLTSPVYTRTGRIFERFQFVELPQLINILRGDMSLVGYRPLPTGHVNKLEKDCGALALNRRHLSSPGLTGFAQISGKATLTNQQRIAIELAESRFFETAGSLKILKVYISLLLLTVLYVTTGANKYALKLRDRYLFDGAALSSNSLIEVLAK